MSAQAQQLPQVTVATDVVLAEVRDREAFDRIAAPVWDYRLSAAELPLLTKELYHGDQAVVFQHWLAPQQGEKPQ